MRFTKEVYLATELLTKVPRLPVPAKTLAIELGTTEFFLQRIIGKLKRAGLVKVKKGNEGGVYFKPGPVPTLLDVYKALEMVDNSLKQGSFLQGVHTNVLDLFASTDIPHKGFTEDGDGGGN